MDNNQIHIRAEITIGEGKAEEFKKLVQDMSRTVEANEPDTIEYRFYINGSETKCIVHEIYRNSEAAIAHNDGVASQKILPRIFSISTITRFDVYGNPSEELQKVLTSVGAQTNYNLFVGFKRS
jgi:quinol monooxygenase YgiN